MASSLRGLTMSKAATSKAGWTTVAFGDVVRLSTERSSDPESDGFERFVGLEHIEPGDLRIRRWGDIADGTTFTSVFRPGQVLFGKRRAYQRKVAVADFSGICSGDIYVLEPKNEALLPELLPFICQTDAFFEHAVGTSAGSLSPRTNWTSLSGFEFALPPIEEQRRIATALAASEDQAEAIRLLRMATSSVLESAALELFSTDIRCGTTVFADVVRDWAYGPRFSSSLYSSRGSLAQLRTTDINDDGEIVYGTIPLVDLAPSDYESHLLRQGDLVMSRSGSCGLTAVFRDHERPTIAAAFLFRISPGPAIDSTYLHEYFSSVLGRRLTASLARGGVQKNIKGSQLLEQQVPCPPLARQHSVVSHLGGLRESMRHCSRRLEQHHLLKAALLSQLEETRR